MSYGGEKEAARLHTYGYRRHTMRSSEPGTNTDYPRSTVPIPTLDELIEQEGNGVVDATDGCQVEPDGVCPHGHPSWMLRLGLI